MDSRIKAVIKRVAKTDISTPADVLGDVVSDILFKDGDVSLFVNKESDNVLLVSVRTLGLA